MPMAFLILATVSGLIAMRSSTKSRMSLAEIGSILLGHVENLHAFYEHLESKMEELQGEIARGGAGRLTKRCSGPATARVN